MWTSCWTYHERDNELWMWLWAANRSALAPNACLSTMFVSESRMQSSLGSLLRNKQLRRRCSPGPWGRGVASPPGTSMASKWPGTGLEAEQLFHLLTGSGVAPCKGSQERVCLHQVGDGLILYLKKLAHFSSKIWWISPIPFTQIYCLTGAIISETRISNIYLN